MKSKLVREGDISFFKLLGTGGGFGYSSKPDFTTYGLLTVWNSLQKAENFLSSSRIMQEFHDRSDEVYSVFMTPTRSRGSWSGVNPFVVADQNIVNDNPLVVLTRATIKPRFIFNFWKRVSGVSRSNEASEGLLFSKGVGELPLVEQATFSIWKSVKEMEAFAHGKNSPHHEAIKAVYANKGFKEELFARFNLLKVSGSWHGHDPVGKYLAQKTREAILSD
ncbi:MAG: spheroidene monooxygenase [Cyclobacteriaceae bacterium]